MNARQGSPLQNDQSIASSAETKRVLFVDDEPKVLDGLRRMLRPMKAQWDMDFVASGSEALARFAARPYDVIVSDMRMPGMDGLQLLQTVREQYPQVVRFILSGQTDREAMLRSVGAIHQFLSKPCEQDVLKARVTRALDLQRLLQSPRLRQLVAGIGILPSLPSLYVDLMDEVRSPQSSIQKIVAIISRDIGMTAKILQIVNSSLFGLTPPVTNLPHAINLLGLEIIQGLALTTQVFGQFQKSPEQAAGLEALWAHSLATGTAARMIAKAEGADAMFVEETFLAGLLHDIGILALSTKSGGQYDLLWQQGTKEGEGLITSERRALGGGHAEVGGFLVGLWGVSDAIVEAIAYHHEPLQTATSCSPLTVVCAVHQFVSAAHGPQLEGLEGNHEDYFRQVNVLDRLPAWRALTEQVLSEGGIHG